MIDQLLVLPCCVTEDICCPPPPLPDGSPLGRDHKLHLGGVKTGRKSSCDGICISTDSTEPLPATLIGPLT